MKVKHLFTAAALLALPLAVTVASAATIEVIETFDFPGTGKLTEPQKINNRGDIVGAVIDPTAGVTRGFYRGRDGDFSAAFAEPNDTAGSTQGRGINDAREICGNYTLAADSTVHGFFLERHAFSEFDLPGASSTILLGINNAGDFAGSEIESDGVTQNGMVSIGGTVTTFAVPGSSATLAYQINASNQSAGYYVDGDGVGVHGYLRESDGTLTFPIDPAGSTATVLFGNNDSNWVVGRYTDADGITHGLFFTTPGDYVSFDFPGSTFTSFNGINQQGYICGRYVDSSGIEHGILAKVHLDGTSQPNKTNDLPATVIKPLLSSPRGLGSSVPAM